MTVTEQFATRQGVRRAPVTHGDGDGCLGAAPNRRPGPARGARRRRPRGARARRRLVRHVNLDIAASAPALDVVAQQVTRVLPYYASVHRGSGYPSQLSTSLVEDARRAVARHVGARDDDLVVFTRNTTDALNLLAGAVPGDTVVLDLEHHANLLPWRSRRVVEGRATIAATLEALDAELARRARRAAVGDRRLERHGRGAADRPPRRDRALPRRAHRRRRGAAAAAPPGRRRGIGHRLPRVLGPQGVRALRRRSARRPRRLARRRARPPRRRRSRRRGAHRRGRLEARASSGTRPARPTSSASSRSPARSSNSSGSATRARREHEPRSPRGCTTGSPRCRACGCSAGSTDGADADRRPLGIATIELERGSVGLVAAALGAEHGISVRAGRFCAHPFFERMATRANGLRASLGAGSSADDVDRFLDALAGLVADGPAHAYDRSPDGWCPRVDDRPRPDFDSPLDSARALAAARHGCDRAPQGHASPAAIAAASVTESIRDHASP